jgi:hypothetical protein
MTSLADLKTAQPVKPNDGRTLTQYAEYTQSLAVHTPASGFKQFAPRDAVTQAKYDAMQSSWLGVESSDKAIADGHYKLDYASDDRGSKASTPLIMPPAAPPPKQSWFCVVQ